MLGFALTTYGLLAWQAINFSLEELWIFTTGEFEAHPVLVIVFGMALIPPTLWEIFILEGKRD